jgi:hypothetical protein
VLAAALSFALGAVLGAALQRWGDGVRASGHLGTLYWPPGQPPPGELESWTEPEDGVERESAGIIVRYDDGETWRVAPDWSVTT